jgi:hypothetical protein
MKKHLRILALFGALAVAAVAATIGTLSQLSTSMGGSLLQADHDTVNANATAANTNFANVNAALAQIVPTSTFVDCVTTAACPSTVRATLHTVIGIGLLATGSPSTYAVTTISPAFTGTTTYSCIAQDVTTIANNVGVLTAGYVSGSAVTFTGPNTNTDTFRFSCVGY